MEGAIAARSSRPVRSVAAISKASHGREVLHRDDRPRGLAEKGPGALLLFPRPVSRMCSPSTSRSKVSESCCASHLNVVEQRCIQDDYEAATSRAQRETRAWAAAERRMQNAHVSWSSVHRLGMSHAIEKARWVERSWADPFLRPAQRLLLATLCWRGQDCNITTPGSRPLVEARLLLSFDVMQLVAAWLERCTLVPTEHRRDVGPVPRGVNWNGKLVPFRWHQRISIALAEGDNGEAAVLRDPAAVRPAAAAVTAVRPAAAAVTAAARAPRARRLSDEIC